MSPLIWTVRLYGPSKSRDLKKIFPLLFLHRRLLPGCRSPLPHPQPSPPPWPSLAAASVFVIRPSTAPTPLPSSPYPHSGHRPLLAPPHPLVTLPVPLHSLSTPPACRAPTQPHPCRRAPLRSRLCRAPVPLLVTTPASALAPQPAPMPDVLPPFLLTMPMPSGVGATRRNDSGMPSVGAAEVIGNTDGLRAQAGARQWARVPVGEHRSGVDGSGREEWKLFFFFFKKTYLGH